MVVGVQVVAVLVLFVFFQHASVLCCLPRGFAFVAGGGLGRFLLPSLTVLCCALSVVVGGRFLYDIMCSFGGSFGRPVDFILSTYLKYIGSYCVSDGSKVCP